MVSDAGKPLPLRKAVLLQELQHGLPGMVQPGCQSAHAHAMISAVGKYPSVAALRHTEVDIQGAGQALIDLAVVFLNLCDQADPHSLFPGRLRHPVFQPALASCGDHQEAALMSAFPGLHGHTVPLIQKVEDLLRLYACPRLSRLLQ